MFFPPLSCRMVGSSRRLFHSHAVHHRRAGNLGHNLQHSAPSNARHRTHIEHFHTSSVLQPSSRCDSRCQFRRFPTLFVCEMFAGTQNDLLRSTIFHTSSLWCRALVDTLREVPHQSNEGLALQARVSGPWPLKKESVLLGKLAPWQGVQIQTVVDRV